MRTTNFGFSSMRLKSGIISACAVVLIVAASATAGCASSNSEDPPSNSEEQNPLISAERVWIMAETAYSQAVSCYRRGELTRSECFGRAYMSVCEEESADEGWSATREERCRVEVRQMTELMLEDGLL